MPTNLIFHSSLAFLLLASPILAQSKTEPATSVQIVNATSVPSISMEVNGTLAYPEFPQGSKTSGGASPLLNVRYKVTDLKSKGTSESAFTYLADHFYTLLVTGDFSTDSSPQALPQPESTGPITKEKFKPNVQFRLIENEALEAGGRPRYRFINAVPRTAMVLNKKEVLPGGELVLEEQPFSASYSVLFGTQRITVPMPQEGIIRNATIVFYRSETGIKFVPVLENSLVSEQSRAALTSTSDKPQ